MSFLNSLENILHTLFSLKCVDKCEITHKHAYSKLGVWYPLKVRTWEHVNNNNNNNKTVFI